MTVYATVRHWAPTNGDSGCDRIEVGVLVMRAPGI